MILQDECLRTLCTEATTAMSHTRPMCRFCNCLQGYYRGLNTSTPLLYFTVSGSSGFPSAFNFSTYLLPGSRPSVPCHPLASTCSLADQESVDSVTVTGTRWLQPGQQQLDPIQLPVNWGRLPLEAELRIGVKIAGNSNVRVALQLGQVAAILFGTPPGRCPPGVTWDSSLLRLSWVQVLLVGQLAWQLWATIVSADALDHWLSVFVCLRAAAVSVQPCAAGSAVLADTNSSRSTDGPTYTSVAALQELAFTLAAPHSTSNTSSNGSSRSNSSIDSVAIAAAAAEDPASSSGLATLDLDPPFSPMVDKYVGLLPPKPRGGGKLLLASSRWGDAVVVDATACLGLNSSR